jgi:uncharacterized membrane protein
LEKHRRSVAKAIPWRATDTDGTFAISWLLTGRPKLAGGIASGEVVTKMALRYRHERAWSRVGWSERRGGRVTRFAGPAAVGP